MRYRAFLPLIALGIAACENSTAPIPAAPGPQFAISDAVHNSGNPHFFFLPPIVKQPVFAGMFDANVDAVVQICVWSGTACGPTIATFGRAAGSGGEVVSVDSVAYAVKWRTKDFDVNPDLIYRIRVMAGPQELGFADVRIVLSNQEAKNVNTSDYIPLEDGHLLNIRFRIEDGALLPPTGPFPIRIDASALTAQYWDLLSIGTFPRSTIPTVSLMPGAYTLRYYAAAGYPSVTFSVTPWGYIDYSPTLDGVLSGRGTSTLLVNGRLIQLDARALTPPEISLTSVEPTPFSTASVHSVTLLPGPHNLRYYAGSGTLDYPNVSFTVDAAGVVDYATNLDGVLSGRSTNALVVNGRTIQIDARALTAPQLSLTSVEPTSFSTATVRTVTLLPGLHNLSYYAGTGPLSNANVSFTIDNAGMVDYVTSLDGVLSGRSTSTLVVNGRTIQLDPTGLTTAHLSLTSMEPGSFSTAAVRAVTLLPGPHNLSYYGGSGTLDIPNASFTMDAMGLVDFAAVLDGALVGRGTATLVVNGRAIQIDATALGVPTFDLISVGTYSATAIATLHLLPGDQGVNAGARSFPFTAGADGNVTYNAVLYPFLAGAGTALLTIH